LGTGAGIIFKGSGFYQTDYRSESYKTGAKKEKDSKSSTKSESKKTKTDTSTKDKCKTCPKKKQ
jgi:predicted nucleic acid-binding Zn ribbon protein